jgi:hypothetical protein
MGERQGMAHGDRLAFPSRPLLLIAAAAVIACGLSVAPRAGAAVYWGSSHNGVGAANLDGTEPQWDYFAWPYPDESDGRACGVAVSSEHLYWAGFRGIGRRRLEGEGVYPATIVPGLQQPCGLTIDQSHLYWGNPSSGPLGSRSGSLGRANLDGSQADRAFVTGLERPCDVTVGGGHVFWIERYGVGRANLDGSSPERPFIALPAVYGGCGLTASEGHLYWGQGGAIARANLEGGEIDHAFIPASGAAEGIAVQGGRVYWAGRSDDGTAAIGRANLDGTEADPAWIPSGEPNLLGVAVDARPTPPYLVLPSRSLRFRTNIRYNLRSGAVLVGVYVPGQGQLTVTSRGLSWKVFRSTEPLPGQGNGYLWWIRIRSGKGAVGRRIRSRLRRRGWARVRMRIAYTQDRVYPVAASRRLTLRRYRHARSGWVQHPRPPRRGSAR